MSTPSRFIADTMLGKLARWLRILGYDTIYFRDIEDHALIQVAVSQHRWLLTRDTLLLKDLRPINCTFVRDDHLRDQLRQVVTELGLAIDRCFLMRCLECNEELIAITREQAQPLVPEYVYQTQQQFSQCPACRRVYWEGTHYHRICDRLHELFPKLQQK
ncbi:MAG: Mut7-C RNAse domain-containing protein [Nitrospiria bacterium]